MSWRPRGWRALPFARWAARTTVAVALASAPLVSCAAPRGAEPGVPVSGASPRTRVLGSGPRVLLAQVRLPPGARFTLPTSVCQDVLVYVRHGAAELDGQRPLLPGRAVRFGLDGAAVSNSSRRDAELYVIVSRSVARRFGPDATLDMQLAPVDPACGEGTQAASLSDLGAQPFVHAGGELRVSLLLDGPGQRARHSSLTRLEASASASVPLHEHEESAEVIFIEQGEGRMRVGDQHVAVRPGTFVYIPPRTAHSFTPSGNSPLHAMQVYAPAGPEQRFRVAPAAPEPQAEGAGQRPPDDQPEQAGQAAQPGEAGESGEAGTGATVTPGASPPEAGDGVWRSAPSAAQGGEG